MSNENNDLKELLGEARAIHLAMRHGAITYTEAKNRVQPILRRVNDHVRRITNQYKTKPRHIRFQDLGRNL